MRDGDAVVAEVLVDGNTRAHASDLRGAGATILDVIPRYETIAAAIPIGALRAMSANCPAW